MWRRATGVAVVLLALGAAGGYVAADRTRPEPVALDLPEPVPAVSPAVPTPPAVELLPDPSSPALAPALPLEQMDFRVGRRGMGVSVGIPTGWAVYKEAEGDPAWNATVPGNPTYTFKLRVALVAGRHQSVGVAKLSRKEALRSAVDEDELADLTYLAETEDAFVATYVQDDHLRVTMERWVSFGSDTAYADISVTGRKVDEQGLADLLARVAASAEPLAALPKEEKTEEPSS
ncbi:hypothetical protein [Nocardioides flavescens]|uniref:Uncharacterized protein n=1 Tax=Nocardioides flavescens TaxID=2691959 RepID=A0A6L7F247_9ACTN|nr:hypothetical protein [Nocardioides flavescens]MXG91171.1 hypothetical protein [Nocardioides flavescens]